MKRILLAASLVFIFGLTVGFTEKAEEDKPEPAWKGSLGISWVSTSGNTDTTSGGLQFTLERKPEPWGLGLVVRGNRAEDSGTVTAENLSVGGRAVRKLSAKWEAFGGLQWSKDPFAGFDSQSVASVGATYLAVSSERHKLSFDGGLAYTWEDRIPPAEDIDFAGGMFGLVWEWKIGANSKLTERLMYYPNFDNSADWRMTSVTGLESSINSWLALKLGFDVRHRNEPIEDNDGTDTTSTASMVINF